MTEQIRAGALLVLIAGIPRLLAAFFLPNTFGDAYVYIRDIGSLSTKLKAGTFAITDLYGFWLPLYQFIAAVFNVFIGNGFYAGKIVSAMFGIGVCLLVYAIVWQMLAHRIAAVLAFALIAFNPLHILNSGSAMTDVPHAFFVLASLYFILKKGWVAAAIFAALAGLVRVESWMFIALIPIIQLLRERRISISAILIMLVPPVLWFYISWKATGDWLACFRVRQQYHDWLLLQNPALARFAIVSVLKDMGSLLISTGVAVICAAFVAGWFVLKHLARRQRNGSDSQGVLIIAPALIFFFAFLALLLVAYLTHQQPLIFPRYGLILFSLGIPILAWTYMKLAQRNARRARTLLISMIAICVLEASIQLVGAVGLLNQISAQRAAADYLRDHFDHKSSGRIFSDEGTVTVMSGIPAERFVTSADAPRDRESFLAFLKERQIECVVYVRKEDSTPAKVFNDLDSSEPESFELMMHSRSNFLPTHIRLFRVRETMPLKR